MEPFQGRASKVARLSTMLRVTNHLRAFTLKEPRMLPAAFEPFVKAAPFCVMARAALESLFAAGRLDDLFRRTAQQQYTRELR